MAAEVPRYRYRVDAADKIVWVDALWLAFAQENGAAELVEDFVLGRSLWDFVSGEDTRRLYFEIHARARSSDRPVVLPFRCDSPSLQRHMRLKITRESGGQLFYESLLVRAVPQRCLQVLDSEQPRSNTFLLMCSCCKRSFVEPMGWLSVEDVSVRLGLFDTQKVPELRHTICPECGDAPNHESNNGNAA